MTLLGGNKLHGSGSRTRLTKHSANIYIQWKYSPTSIVCTLDYLNSGAKYRSKYKSVAQVRYAHVQ